MTSLRVVLITLFACLVVSIPLSPAQAQQTASARTKITISGTVLLPDGQPASDARVLAGYRDSAQQGKQAETHTDAEGRYSFVLTDADPRPAVMLFATKPGFAFAYNWYSGKPEGAVLRLGAKPAALVGTIVDEQGQAVAQAEVTITSGRIAKPSADPETGYLDFYKNRFLHCTSDAQGEFRLEDLPFDAIFWFDVDAPHQARITGKRDLSDTTPLRVVLQPEATIAGHVLHEGKPVAGITISAQSQAPGGWGKALTGADGGYGIEHLPAGKYNVGIADFPEGLTGAAVEGVAVKAGDHATGVDLTLTPGALVTGKVTAADGAPMAGASVASYGPARPPSGAWCHVVKTAADGTYSVRLPEGHSRLYYMGNLPGYAHGTAKPDAQEVDLKEGETKPGVDFLLTLAPKLRGKVLLPDGQPAAGVAIRLLSYGWGPEGVGDPGATTDAQGAFEVTAEDRFPGGGDGPLQMLAQDTDKRLAALVSVADPAQALTMQLAPGAYLAARAVDLKDQPVPQVLVIARGTDRPLATATTDADGQVLLGPLPGGTALRLSAGGRWRYLVAAEEWEGLTVTPAAGAIQQLPPLRLNPQGRSLKGWVGDAAGQPVAGALVYARGVEEPAKTDAQGNFELTGLPARGTLTIVAAHPTEPRFAVKETDPDWGFTPVLALQPLGAVTGQVLDAAGKPAAGARLALSSLMQFYDPPALDVRLREAGCSSYTRAQADAEGRFRLEGLLPGVTYEMYILRDDNLITGHREFQAVPGETVELGEVRPAK